MKLITQNLLITSFITQFMSHGGTTRMSYLRSQCDGDFSLFKVTNDVAGEEVINYITFEFPLLKQISLT